MSDHDEPASVGSLGEEAVKLLDALRSWAGQADDQPQATPGASLLAEINEHIATGGQDCTYCPLCRLITMARQTSPEVKHHLGAAATSALQAVSALLASPTQHGRTGDPGVEHIDLSEEWEDD